jgi:hypothetical protein
MLGIDTIQPFDIRDPQKDLPQKDLPEELSTYSTVEIASCKTTKHNWYQIKTGNMMLSRIIKYRGTSHSTQQIPVVVLILLLIFLVTLLSSSVVQLKGDPQRQQGSSSSPSTFVVFRC